MPGFFSSKDITQKTDHLIDPQRIGQFLLDKRHTYSREELAIRGFIISSILLGFYLGWEKKHSFSSALLHGLVGFIASHTVAITPLIYARWQIRETNKRLENAILTFLNQSSIKESTKQLIKETVTAIQALSLTTETRGNARETLGKRKRLLTEIHDHLTSNESTIIESYWHGTKDTMLQQIDEQSHRPNTQTTTVVTPSPSPSNLNI